MNRSCVFLDRDGVLNEDRLAYTYRLDDFKIVEGVPDALRVLHESGFLLVVITNQGGLSRGIYTQEQMDQCHNYLQEQCNGLIDYFYFSPYHPTVTASLSRKPGTLLFERAISKFSINTSRSWMIGDRERDLVPARKLGIKTIQLGDGEIAGEWADHLVTDMQEATSIILSEICKK